jgi:hypothetical protein
MLNRDPLLKRPNRCLQGLKLRRQHDQACPGIVRQRCIGVFCNDRQWLFDPFASLRAIMPSSARWDRIALISCARVHQKIPGAMVHQMGLLLGRLHLHEAHRRLAASQIASAFAASFLLRLM